MLCESLATEYPSAPYTPCQLPCVAVSVPTKLATAAATGCVIVVESLALAVADPPPDALTWFSCGVLAFAVTFTVTVIGGGLAPPFRAPPLFETLPHKTPPLPPL